MSCTHKLVLMFYGCCSSTMVMLSLPHKYKCCCFVYVFQNLVIIWHFGLLLLAGHICDQ